MPREFPRTRRVGEQLRRDLARLIRDEIDDRRMVMVSITAVEVTRDFAHAKVFVTYLGSEDDRKAAMDVLGQHAAPLRARLGRELRIRTIPRLAFVYDESVERGARLSSLIASAVAEDVARHRNDETEGSDAGPE